MKKLLYLLLIAILMLGLSGCETTKTSDTAQKDPEETSTEEPKNDPEENVNTYVLGTPVTKDNVSISITNVEVSNVTGDRTEDNYAQEKGEYFAIGSDIVKAADYDQIEIDVKIENASDKAITFSSFGWEAKLPDGYEFNNIEVTGKAEEQLPSNYTGDGKLVIIKEKAISVDTLLLTYHLMDYNEEWQQAIWKAASGEMNEEEYMEKFNPQPIEFELKLNN